MSEASTSIVNPPPPVPVTKPGFQTSEFWLHILAGLAVCLLTKFNPVSAGLPSWAQAAYAFVAPLVLGFLAKSYGDSRAEVKMAGVAASAAVTDQATAAASLRGT